MLPVLLMLLKGISDLATPTGSLARQVFDTVGAPTVALLLAVLLAYFTLGKGAGMRREQTNESLGSGLPGIAGILLIVAAGGGFKQLLVDAGVANVIADWATGANISVLLLGWLVAVGIRLATGSATVATTTAAGIVGALAGTLSTTAPGAAGARDRLWLAVLQPRQRRRVLAGEAVLRPHRGSDHQDLVDHGDRHLGGGVRLRDRAQSGVLATFGAAQAGSR